MALDLYGKEDIRAHILAGVVTVIATAQAQGLADVGYIAGVLTFARYTALHYHLDWQRIVADAQRELGHGLADLLDAALQVGVIEVQARGVHDG